MWTIKKIASFSAMGIKTALAYVASVWASVFVNILQVLVFYYIWKAVYADTSVINGITLNQMITYVIISRILFMGISFGVNNWMAHQIQTGSIAMELLRPIDYQLALYAIRIGDFIMFTVLNGIPVFLFSMLAFDMMPPVSVAATSLFVLSVLFAVTIAFFIEFMVGLISFYTTNGWGLHVLKEGVMNLLSGAIVPLAFFPGVFKDIVNFLPFKDMVYTPISIYLGMIEGDKVIHALLFQLMWIVVLFIISRLFYKIALKKVVVQGG